MVGYERWLRDAKRGGRICRADYVVMMLQTGSLEEADDSSKWKMEAWV